METRLHGGRAGLFAAVVALVSAFSPGVVEAAGKRVAVGVYVRGKDARAVEKKVVLTLKQHGTAPVPARKLETAARRLRVGLTTDAGVAAVAKRLRLAAVVVGDVRDRGARAQLRLLGADGRPLAGGAWSSPGGARKLAAIVGRSFWSRMSGAFEELRGGGADGGDVGKRARPEDPFEEVATETPRPPAPAPAAPPRPAPPPSPPPPARAPEIAAPEAPPATVAARDEDETVAQPMPRRRAAAPAASIEREPEAGGVDGAERALALDGMVSARLVGRDLSWVKDANMALRPYSAQRAPALGFLVAWNPAAHFMAGGWPTYLGVVVSGEYAPGVVAGTMEGGQYPTSDSDYWGGARLRVPFGALSGALSVGYGQHAFVFHSGNTSPRGDLAVPDVRYTYVRLGADARLALPAKLSVMGGAGYRAVLDAGTQGYEAQSMMYFQRMTVSALDVFAAVGFRFIPMLEARLGFDVRRYGMNMHPRTSDTLVVSGGIDQYLAFWLSVAVLLDR